MSFNFFPSPNMHMNESLNATTRLIIALSLLLFIVTHRITVILLAMMTIFFIYMYHYIFYKRMSESFENPNADALTLKNLKKVLFDRPTPINPFGNVLNSDIESNPLKKAAPPIDEPATQEAIMDAAQQSMIRNNPTFPGIDKRLLQNMGDVFEFEQSLQPFYTNPATTIPNDQNAFADFCYGSMISCKEGNLFACARNNDAASHYNNY